MISVITGDIINSSKLSPEIWLMPLKSTLYRFGKSPKDWEIFRGDSFQLAVSPKKAVEAAMLIRATIKQCQDIDVRMAIGIGDVTYQANTITESNGSAFANSGKCFEKMGNKTLRIKSPWPDFDEAMNTMLDLSSEIMEKWTPKAAEAVQIQIENPRANQEKIALMIGISQSNVSGRFKRAGFDAIMGMNNYYIKKIKNPNG